MSLFCCGGARRSPPLPGGLANKSTKDAAQPDGQQEKCGPQGPAGHPIRWSGGPPVRGYDSTTSQGGDRTLCVLDGSHPAVGWDISGIGDIAGGAPDGRRPDPAPRRAGNGQGGIRTRGTPNEVRRFSKPVPSATRPPVRLPHNSPGGKGGCQRPGARSVPDLDPAGSAGPRDAANAAVGGSLGRGCPGLAHPSLPGPAEVDTPKKGDSGSLGDKNEPGAHHVCCGSNA